MQVRTRFRGVEIRRSHGVVATTEFIRRNDLPQGLDQSEIRDHAVEQLWRRK
jgi:hypothetical protein